MAGVFFADKPINLSKIQDIPIEKTSSELYVF
jgi:hypothetical protein